MELASGSPPSMMMTTMMMAILVLLLVVVGLLVEVMSIGRVFKKMRSEFVGLSSLFGALCQRGRKLEGSTIFWHHGEVATVGASCSIL